MARNGKCKEINTKVVWETCTEERQLEQIIRDKLGQYCRKALSILVSMSYDEDVALKGLLERGYCIGTNGCLTNLVGNSSDFLTGNKGVCEEQQDPPPPPPFRNLELLVEFNFDFMVYLVQRYRPKLNRISILRNILRNNLNLNGSIRMDENGMHSGFEEILSKLKFDNQEENPPDHDDNLDKEMFLALEIREIFSNLDVSISEDEKNMMLGDLERQLKSRIRWATKKMSEAIRKPTTPTMYLKGQIQRHQKYKDMILFTCKSELSSLQNEIHDAEKAIKFLQMTKEEIKAEVSASKLIVSETRKKCLELGLPKFDKKKIRLLKNWETQKVKLQEELAMERQKLSKWEQQLVETDAAIIQAELKIVDLKKALELSCAQYNKGRRIFWENWMGNVQRNAEMKIQLIAKNFSILTSMATNSVEIS